MYLLSLPISLGTYIGIYTGKLVVPPGVVGGVLGVVSGGGGLVGTWSSAANKKLT